MNTEEILSAILKSQSCNATQAQPGNATQAQPGNAAPAQSGNVMQAFVDILGLLNGDQLAQLNKIYSTRLNTGTPLPTSSLKDTGWIPYYYVVCTPKITVANNVMNITYDPGWSGIYDISAVTRESQGSITTPFQFALAVADTTFLQFPQHQDDNYGGELEVGQNPMEFTIRGDCYIFFNLRNLNWQFSSTYTGITMDPSCLSSKPADTSYGDIHEVGNDGNDYVPDPATGAVTIDNGCDVFYFSARLLPPNTPAKAHSFNLHLELLTANGVLRLTIDPDIKNDGNQPPWSNN